MTIDTLKECVMYNGKSRCELSPANDSAMKVIDAFRRLRCDIVVHYFIIISEVGNKTQRMLLACLNYTDVDINKNVLILAHSSNTFFVFHNIHILPKQVHESTGDKPDELTLNHIEILNSGKKRCSFF